MEKVKSIRKKYKILLFIGLIFWSSNCFGQAWLRHYGEGRYQEAIQKIRPWIETHPDSEKIGRFFLSQSAYELGLQDMQQNNLSGARNWFRESINQIRGLDTSRYLRDNYPEYDLHAFWRRLWALYRYGQVQSTVEQCLRIWRRMPVPSQDLWRHADAEWRRRFVLFISSFAAQRLSLELALYDSFESDVRGPALEDALNYLIKSVVWIKRLGKESDSDIRIIKSVLYGQIADAVSRMEGLSKKTSKRLQQLFGTSERSEIVNRCYLQFQSNVKNGPASLQSLTDWFSLYSLDENTIQGVQNNYLISALALARADDFRGAKQRIAALAKELPEALGWLIVFKRILKEYERVGITFKRFPSNDPRAQSLRILFALNRSWMNLYYAFQTNNMGILEGELNLLEKLNIPKHHRLQDDVYFTRSLIRLLLGEDPLSAIRNAYGTFPPNEDLLKIIRFVFSQAGNSIGQSNLMTHLLNGPISKILRESEFQKRFPEVIAFYQVIERYLRAMLITSHSERVQAFANLADQISPSLQNPYYWEMQYLKGRALIESENYTKAKNLFWDIYKKFGSLRALYFLGVAYSSLKQKEDLANARYCFTSILEQMSDRTEWEVQYFVGNARAELKELQSVAPGISPTIKIGKIIYPDILVSGNAPGGTIRFEELGDQGFIQKGLREKAKKWVLLYAPHFPLVQPTGFSPNRYAYSLNFLSNISLGLDEHYRVEPPSLYVKLEGLKDPSIVNLITNNKKYGELKYQEADTSWIVKNIQVDTLNVSIFSKNHVPFLTSIPVDWSGQAKLVVPLIPQYQIVSIDHIPIKDFENKELHIFAVHQKNAASKAILIPKYWLRWINRSKLEKDFDSDLYLRDMAYHTELGGFLVTDARKSCVWFYPVKGDSVLTRKKWKIQFQSGDDGLLQPEGITVAENGLVYIADFGNHRIVVVDSSRKVVRILGHFAVCDSTNKIGRPVFLSIPTKAFDHPTGRHPRFANKLWPQLRLLWIADDCGIKITDEKGRYLYQVFKKELNDPMILSFWVVWNLESPMIYILDRRKKEIRLIRLNSRGV